MENQTPAIKPIAYKYGMYSALLSIAGLMILYLFNLDKSWILSGASIIVSILIFVYGIREYKLQNTNKLSIGQAIKVGLAIAAIGGLLAGVYAYFHYEFVYPEFIVMQEETAYEQMQSQNMTEMQIEQAMSFNKMFMNSTFFSLSTVLGSLIFGLIISFIAGLIMKQE